MKQWSDIINPFLSSEEGLKLKKFISQRRKETTVWPDKKDVFSAFNEDVLPYKDVRVVILGQDPYPHNAAHGLAFSSMQNKIPKSLEIIFQQLHEDLYNYMSKETFNKMFSSPNLSSWHKQGILLFNTVMTVDEGEPGSHKNIGWEKLSYEIMIHLNNHKNPICFLLWGKDAQQYSSLITNRGKHLVLESAHPAAEIYKPGSFLGNKHFKKMLYFIDNHYEEPRINVDISECYKPIIERFKEEISNSQIPFPMAKETIKKLKEEIIKELTFSFYKIDLRTNKN